MNPTLQDWALLALVLALELLALVAPVALLQRHLKSATRRRQLWQAAFVSMALLGCLQFSGLPEHWISSNPAGEGASSLRVVVTPLADPVPMASLADSDFDSVAETGQDGGEDGITGTIRARLPLAATPLPAAWVLGLYAAGMMAGLGWWVVGRVRLWRLTRACEPVTDPRLLARLERLRQALGMRRTVRLWQGSMVTGPVAFGIWSPTILVPAGFCETFNEAQQEVILAHETAHVSNHDPVWHLLADLTTLCWWWHPAVWWARRHWRAAGEAAADEASLVVADGPGTLAECLVRMGQRLVTPRLQGGFGVAGHGFKSALGRRVESLLRLQGTTWQPPTRRWTWAARVAGAALVSVTVAWAGTVGAGGGPAENDSGMRTIGQAIRLAATEPQTPAVPPAPPVPPPPPPPLQPSRPVLPAIPPLPVTAPSQPVGVPLVEELPATAPAPADPSRVEAPVLELSTRWFRVDTNALAFSLMDAGKARAGGDGGMEAMLESLRQVLAQAGVRIQPPRALYFNTSQAALMVRATLPELDVVEETLQVLNRLPHQVAMEVQWCEIKSGSPWPETLRQHLAELDTPSTNLHAKGILSPDQFRQTIQALKQEAGTDLLAAPKIITLSGRHSQIKVVDVRHIVTDLDLSQAPDAAVPPASTPPDRPEAASGTSSIQPVAQPFELGPVLDLVPNVGADELSIHLAVTGSIKQFIGYDLDGEDTVITHGTEVVHRAKTPLPVFRVRQITTDAVVKDGQTLVLSGGLVTEEQRVMDRVPVLSSIPLAGRLFRHETRQYLRKELILFITPRLMKPDGVPLHDEAFLKAAANQ